ncbi:hypothetical protein EGR_10508 [Echinococcus granulosus]|uniref:Uncharacterized protein n=1 Tax=Echinococcus granulosus TaxID=6210 RepID=W6U0J1_ECHGR|nr:hypothetical protein EGR_10508 [Echinococcus granulosus]EUB54635.1 hypothetical protein EGR_10508 [Echinococcus granulosus]
MLSDIIVASTLFFNGVAILNFNLKPDPIFDEESSSFASKTKEFIYNVRYFRLFIGIWNLLLIVLMFTWVFWWLNMAISPARSLFLPDSQ